MKAHSKGHINVVMKNAKAVAIDCCRTPMNGWNRVHSEILLNAKNGTH